MDLCFGSLQGSGWVYWMSPLWASRCSGTCTRSTMPRASAGIHTLKIMLKHGLDSSCSCLLGAHEFLLIMLYSLYSVSSYTPLTPREGEPKQPNLAYYIRDYAWLLGHIRAYWEDLAPLPWALTAYVINGSLLCRGM